MTSRCARGAGGRNARVALVGQTFWARQLAGMLDTYAADLVDATALEPRRIGLLARPPAAGGPDVVLRIGFRPGSPTPRGRGFDAVWTALRAVNPRPRVVHYWIGTDVQRAVDDWRARRLTSAFFRSAVTDLHLAAAPWLVEELRTLGVGAAYVPHPARLPEPTLPLRVPDRFAVLGYVPSGRFEYYGGAQLMAAASRLPGIPFDVLGSSAPPSGVDAPPNARFLGWRTDVSSLLEKASVYVRLTRHDAMSVMVREALAFGCHVVYTYPIPAVIAVPPGDAEAVTGEIGRLADAHRRHALERNTAGRRWVLEEFDPEGATRRLAALLREAA